MQHVTPSTQDVTRAGVWPAIFSLLVTAVLIVVRLQVDWTASCSLKTDIPDACGDDHFSMFFAWVPAAFAFGLAHIIGAAGLHGVSSSRFAACERTAKFIAYFAIHVFPVFGWYFFYAGLAGGALISLTVIGLVVAPVAGILTAGFAGGVLLALAAGPSFLSTGHAGWKRLLVYYGVGSALGALVLAGGQILFDPQFAFLAGPARPWLTGLGALASAAFSCVLVWACALKAASPSLKLADRQDFRSGMMKIAAVALALVVPVHLMVVKAATFFQQAIACGAPLRPSFAAASRPLHRHWNSRVCATQGLAPPSSSEKSFRADATNGQLSTKAPAERSTQDQQCTIHFNSGASRLRIFKTAKRFLS
jgi:hypothetical protein